MASYERTAITAQHGFPSGGRPHADSHPRLYAEAMGGRRVPSTRGQMVPSTGTSTLLSSIAATLAWLCLAAAPRALANARIGTHAVSAAALHIRIAEHGRKLVVHVSGPSGRDARVAYIATYKGRRITSDAHIVTLAGGKQTTSFKLSAQVAARAHLKVSARLLAGRQSRKPVEPQMPGAHGDEFLGH